MTMKNPVHPGQIVKEDCLRELGLTVTEAAAHMGVGRAALSALVNERASVSIEMAYRLSKAFGSTPDHWMRMQLAYELAQSRSLMTKIDVERIVAA
ncbi:MAG: HigA family addiction module antidote protein [Proteobacteria bacterium]|nr:HigA family addiction module antidote protein [Pseudomonadota bacterium]